MMCVGGLSLGAQGGVGYLADAVAAEPPHPGELRASEVPIRGLRPRTAGPDEAHDTLTAVRDFHATRLEWIYELTPDFVKKVRGMGVSVAGTISTGTGNGLSTLRPDWQSYFQIQTLDGKPTTAPWMRTWNGGWLDIHHPEVRQASLTAVKTLIDMGVNDIQRDDAAGNVPAVQWGAPFSDRSMAAFRAYLKKNVEPAKLTQLGVKNVDAFDYREHLKAQGAPVGDAFNAYQGGELKVLFRACQEQAMIDFFTWLKKEADAYAGRHVPLSMNNSGRDFDRIHQLADWWIGELAMSHATPEYLHALSVRVRNEKRAQTLTMPIHKSPEETPEWIQAIRRTMATIYACGMLMEMPWDTYLPAPSAPRYYGNPKDYADLSGFIRANAKWFDGYAAAAAVGGLVESPDVQQTSPVQVWSEQGLAFAFARVKPGVRSAPVVVHLIDWSEKPGPFTVTVDSTRLFGGQPMRARLLTPLPYDAAVHAAASKSRNYQQLSRSVELAAGRFGSVTIPALAPWGLLVLEPMDSAPDAPAPLVRRLPARDAAIEIVPPIPGCRIAVTTDGSEPREASASSQPVRVPQGKTALRIRAVGWAKGRASTETNLLLPSADKGAAGILNNGTFDAELSEWRVVSENPDAFAVTVTAKGSPFKNGPAARLNILEPAGVVYGLRLVQPVFVEAGSLARLSGRIVSDRAARVRIGIQGAEPPNSVVILDTYELEAGKPVDLNLIARCATSMDAWVQFDVGECPAGTVLWIDNVALTLGK
jgi:hypothetical protein